jgi:RHS repeat-associated protein
MSRVNYNDKGQVISEIDARGNSVIYAYDNFGRKTTVMREGDEASCCNEGKTFYDQFGRISATLAADGRLTIYCYDKLGRQDRLYSGEIVELESNEYKFEGLPIDEEFDIFVTKNDNEPVADGIEKLELDNLTFVKHTTVKTTVSTLTGKLTTLSKQIVIVRKQPIQRVEFDFAGRTIASYDAKNNQTLYFHDSLGRQIAVVQPPSVIQNKRLAFENYYSNDGRIVKRNIMLVASHSLLNVGVWRPGVFQIENKRSTLIEYNILGQILKVIQYDMTMQRYGPTTYREYDILGNLAKIINPLGNETNYRYDNLNRKILEINPDRGETKFTYYRDGRLKSLTDPVGNKTSWSYNFLGSVSREQVLLDQKNFIRYFYRDALNNIVAKIDLNNHIISWTYDKRNRPTSEVWYDSWASFRTDKPHKKFITTYNKLGAIKSIADGDNKFTFKYGIFGNKINETQYLAGFEKPIELNFITDINGLKTQKIVKINDQIDHENSYEFDVFAQITKLEHSGKDVLTKRILFTYTPLGQLSDKTHFAEKSLVVKTNNFYDELQRLTKIVHSCSDKIYSIYEVKWDSYSRVVNFDYIHINELARKNHSNYSYDKISQLINVKSNFSPPESYKYDLNGNRQQVEIQDQKQTYETSGYNRLLSDENYRYDYDREGNRISKTSKKDGSKTNYFWDNRNRLVKIETPSETIEYVYDYLNRLVKRTQDKNETHFIHDGWQIILQFDNKNLKPTHRYLWGNKQDELLCDNDNWTLGDHLNTIRDIVKSDGTVANHFDYNSFGKLISVTKNTDSTFFAYTGKLFDKTSELQWNINRWYDPNVGRWMSEDPIGFEGRDVNKYRYTRNCYLNSNDPLGLLTLAQAKDIISTWSKTCSGGASHESAVRGEIYGEDLMEGIWQLAIDSMLIGVPIPESMVGRITWTYVKDVISNVVQNVGNGDPANLTEDQIKTIILNTLQVPLEEATILAPIVRKLIDQSLNYNIEDCLLVNRTREHDTTLPLNAGTRSVKLNCLFMVCAKIRRGFFSNTVGDWSVKGRCHFECSSPPIGRCCSIDNNEVLYNVNIDVDINRTGNNGNCNNN